MQAGVGYRQFFSFDISGIPSGATIVLATLQLDQQVVTGTPFATHGVVIADHVDYGAALDAADYAGGTLTSNIGTLGGDATIGIKTLDVTSRVQADVTAARTRSQYRVRFSVLGSDSDGVNDYVTYTDAENSSTAAGAVPVLLVSYQ